MTEHRTIEELALGDVQAFLVGSNMHVELAIKNIRFRLTAPEAKALQEWLTEAIKHVN